MEVMEIKDNIEYEKTKIDDGKEVIVHCTDFFPKDSTILCNYDGNKIGNKEIEYDGVIKEVASLIHRHTTHFVRNGVVRSTGDGAGTWNQPKYIIIEPLEPHMKEFLSLSTNDSYTNGSVKLTDKAIMLVRSDCYDEISEEEYAPFTVIKYTGDYVKCVEKAFGILGIRSDIEKIDSNAAEHSNSFEMVKERLLNYRNLYINYITDNAWDGKSDITITEEQLFHIFNLAKENNYYNTGTDYNVNSNTMQDWFKFYMLLTNIGAQEIENGFTIKSEDDMINYYDEIGEQGFLKEDDVIERLTKYYESGPQKALELYKKYLSFEKERILQNEEEKVDINNINIPLSELYEFKHHNEAKSVTEYHKQNNIPADIVFTASGLTINGYGTGYNYDIDYLSNKLNGELDNNDNFWFNYEITGNVQDFIEVDNHISNVVGLSKILKEESQANSIDGLSPSSKSI